MSKSAILDMLKSANEEQQRGGFSGTRIPFFKPAGGKTELLWLSDLEDETPEGSVPGVQLYRYYPISNGDNPVKLNGVDTYEVAYKKGDPIHPNYIAQRRKNDKYGKFDPATYQPNSVKGFAYIVNLTGLKAVKIWNEENRVPKAKDFSGTGMEEVKAAKVYLDEYKAALKKHDDYRKQQLDAGEEDPGEFVYHGVFIYNFNVSVTKAIDEFVKGMFAEDVEVDDITLKDYTFGLSKDGTGMKTQYSLFTIDYANTVPEDLIAATNDFLENNTLSDFSGLLERRRNKPEGEEEELGEEYKISNVAKQEVDSDDDEW